MPTDHHANAPAIRRGLLAMLLVGGSVSVTSMLSHYPQLAGQSWRYAGAAAVLWLVIVGSRRPMVPPAPGEWARLIVLATIGLAGFNLLLLAATRTSPATVVASVIGAAPIAMAIAASFLERRRPSTTLLVGAAVVAVAVAVSQHSASAAHAPAWAPSPSGDIARPIGVLLCVGAMLCEIAFSILAAPLLPRLGAWNVSAWACTVAALLFGASALLTPGPDLVMPTRAEALALAWLAVVTTAVAFGLWYSAVDRLGAASAGLLTGAVPLGALAAQRVLDDEAPSPTALIDALLACVGIAIGLRTAPTTARPLTDRSIPSSDHHHHHHKETP